MRVMIVSMIAALALSPAAARAQETGAGGTPRITVTGEAVVKVVPDRVFMIFGVETWDGDVREAKNENDRITRRTMTVIERAGIGEKDIRTDQLSIEPRYKNEYEKERFLGFYVRNSISVVLSDMERIDDLIMGVLTAGVTHIHRIQFETTALDAHREEARRLAILAAREKAEKMASVLGRSIGNPIAVAETRLYTPWNYVGGWWGLGRGQGLVQNVIQESGGVIGDYSDTIALGRISINAGVELTFELK